MERRVFVSGIGFDITENELRSYFEKYGPMTEFKLLRDRNGDSRGLAFVSFQKEISLYKCVNEVSHRIGERSLSIKTCDEQVTVSGIPSKRLYVSLLNLPDISEDIIRGWFTDCGQVHSVSFSPDDLKSYCIVTFTSEEAVDRSLTKLYTIKGKPLFTRKAIRREDVKKADQWEKERAAREEKLKSNPGYQYMAARQFQDSNYYSAMPSLLGSSSTAAQPQLVQQTYDAQTFNSYDESTKNNMYNVVRDQANHQRAYQYQASSSSSGSNVAKDLTKYGYY